jgi:hypothetical protein
LNFPIPSEEQRGRGASAACIVKLYDADAESLRVCDTVEIIGVLCVNPEIANLPEEGAGLLQDSAWRDAKHPSTSMVPRLHALGVRRLPFFHPLLPYTPAWLSEARLATAFQRQFGVAGALQAARSAAIAQLAKHLGGDVMAAEYTLMLLVSRAFAEAGDKRLGSWSLNLAKWPEVFDTNALATAVGELVPRAVRLEITTDSLNTQRWRPRKDYVANRLVAGQLQLASGTCVVLDETRMATGQLSPDGVKNLHAIQALVIDSQLKCDFMSCDVKIPLEVSCVLVSEGKSLVKDVDVLLPLRPTSVDSSSVPTAALDAARWLLSLVTRSPRSLRIPEPVEQAFGEDFAAVRQNFKVKADLANAWMCVARARCLTFGEDELSLQRWREVMELEQTRLCRCREDGMLEE